MGVGLLPLEFTDCVTDSPHFRDNLHAHEKELDKTSQQIKRLIKEVKELLTAARNLSRAQRTLSNSLQNFNFECIGTSQTDDEVVISKSLAHFGRLIASIEDERDRMLELAYDRIILPLENFRKEHIGGVKEGKKKFDKHTAKFCQSQERYLNLSTKKQDVVLQEADATLQMEQRHFQQASLEYVCLLQQVQERKKFEFVETLLGFMFGWLTFYHQGHEVAEDFQPYMRELQLRIQKTRENFNATRDKTESLMKKMLEMRSVEPANKWNKAEDSKHKPVVSGSPQKTYTREGYLFMMEKKAFGTTWTKLYCMYQKDTKEFTMIPYNQMTGKTNPSEKMILASCVRRMSDSIEKRFCFDLTSVDKPGVVYTLQALSEEDRKLWMDVMDGKEPMYTQPGKSSRPEERALDDVGFAFVAKCIETLEKRGLEEQGLYRVVGITSKVTKLLSLGLDRRRLDRLSLDDVLEWESKTITSALKTYLRNLPEPLTTFRYHNAFIAAAKQETRAMRVNDVHVLMHRIPKANFNMLDMLIQHLINVAAKADKNLMSVSNLGVCFGPTLLRPEVETVAAIMDIKFCNVVVEILIENYHTIFKKEPENVDVHSLEAPPAQLVASAALPHLHHAMSKSLQHDLNVSMHSIVEGGASSGSHVVGSGSVAQRYLKNVMTESHSMQPLPPSSVQQRLVARHHGPVSHGPVSHGPVSHGPAGRGPVPAPAYSESNLLSLQQQQQQQQQQQSLMMAQAPPQAPTSSHVLHKAKPMTYASSCADYLNSTSSSNESVSSLSSRDANSLGNANSLGSYVMLTPQKNKRAVGAKVDSRYTSSYQPMDTLRVRTLYACLGENDGELSFEPNQIITNVRSSLEPGWLEGTLNGKSGLVPENYVEVLP